jgi:alpha-amylase
MARAKHWESFMSDPISIRDVDLTPIPGKPYFSIDREWREEFIYFLMVDRFQDAAGHPVTGGTGRTAGVDAPNGFFGGKIAGITANLDYIAGLGCTAIWLSPIFECNSYYGYDINNYLNIDPRAPA